LIFSLSLIKSLLSYGFFPNKRENIVVGFFYRLSYRVLTIGLSDQLIVLFWQKKRPTDRDLRGQLIVDNSTYQHLNVDNFL